MKEFAKRFYKSAAWKHCRALVWSRDRGLCVDCLRRGLVTAAEEVHHIEPLTPENINDPGVALNLDNLVSLCRECHKARHEAKEGAVRRYKINSDGRITAL